MVRIHPHGPKLYPLSSTAVITGLHPVDDGSTPSVGTTINTNICPCSPNGKALGFEPRNMGVRISPRVPKIISLLTEFSFAATNGEKKVQLLPEIPNIKTINI